MFLQFILDFCRIKWKLVNSGQMKSTSNMLITVTLIFCEAHGESVEKEQKENISSRFI